MPRTPPPTYEDALVQRILNRSGTTPLPNAPRMQARSLRTPSAAPPSVPSGSTSSSSDSCGNSTKRTPSKAPLKPIVEDPIPRPAEKPKPLSSSTGWQSDTSHARQQKEVILKSYRKKSTSKSPSELSSPGAKIGCQVQSLIAYHPHQPLLLMDLSKPWSSARLGGGVPQVIRTIDLDQLATTSPLSSMRIQCDLFSFSIHVKASRKSGITHRDIINAVRDAMHVNVPKKEWDLIKDPHREFVKRAFERRCRNSDELYAVERQRGLKRVDLLSDKTIWKGISAREGTGAWTLHLSNR